MIETAHTTTCMMIILLALHSKMIPAICKAQSTYLLNSVYYRFAFVEFSEPGAVNTALQYNGVIFGGRPLK